MEKRLVGVNDRGIRVGDSHHNARLTNAEVDLLLSLRDEGWSYQMLANKFELSKSGARFICTGRNRNQTPVRYKKVYAPARHTDKVTL